LVYFIQAVEGGRIKIGTTIRLTERLKTLAKEAGSELRVLAVVDGDRKIEKGLHRRFSQLRAVGEWFEPGDDLLGFIVQEGREWNGENESDYATIKIRRDVLDDCRLAAAMKSVSLTDYISDAMREVAKRDVDAAIAERQKSEQSKSPMPKR
jgi:hypothetical protein